MQLPDERRNLHGRAPGHHRGGVRRRGVPIVETLESRQLMASIAGTVFADANANRVREAAEAGLPGRTVYVDRDGDNKLDAGELRATTAANGTYKFSSLA